MIDPELYKGREQTYIKHYVLNRYLQKLAYKIGWHRGGTLNYVDCFAGPWQHSSGSLDDTSPFIAIRELRKARDTLHALQRPPLKIRCLFIEKNKEALEFLSSKLASIEDIEVHLIHGEFEQNIEEACRFAQSAPASFSFFFIDPTGWTGYPMKTIAPILRLEPGEVLINFMTQFISRFADSERPGDVASFTELFGSHDYHQQWEGLTGLRREETIVEAYCERVKAAGGFEFVVPTTILDPLSERTHFHLIYGTRHIEGLRVFRNEAERPAGKEQKSMRWLAHERKQREATGQMGLFADPVGPSRSDALEQDHRARAKSHLLSVLAKHGRVRFEDLEREVLPFQQMTTQRLKNWLVELKKQGDVSFEGLEPRERVPKQGKNHFIVWDAAK